MRSTKKHLRFIGKGFFVRHYVRIIQAELFFVRMHVTLAHAGARWRTLAHADAYNGTLLIKWRCDFII
jgi:hypothetical protein